METIFKTSRFTRIIYPLIILFSVFAIIYSIYFDGNILALVIFLPLCILFYYQAYQKYVLQDTAFAMKNGFGGTSHSIAWSDIEKISLDKKDIRIDYTKVNGMNGFLSLRDVENKDLLLELLKNTLSEKHATISQ